MGRITDEEMEDRARALRKSIGLENQAFLDMMTVIQKIKATYKRFGYLRVPDVKMPEAEGQWDADEGVIHLRESVFCGMQRREPRARWTVAHEIAHFALKHSGLRNRSTTETAAEKYVARVQREENEAQRFAAAFLAPRHLIKETGTAEEIAQRFGLSYQAAAIRKGEVEAMNRRARGQTRALPDVVVDYLKEAQRRGLKLRTDLD